MYATTIFDISYAEMRIIYEKMNSEGILNAAAYVNRTTDSGMRIAVKLVNFIKEAFQFANSAIVLMFDAIDNIDVLPQMDGFKFTIQHIVPQSTSV